MATETTYPIIYDRIDQGTPEWDFIRSGKVTATGIKKLLVEGKYKYGFGKGADTYAKRIANQRLSGKVTPDDEDHQPKWIGKAAHRGKTYEKEAMDAYKISTFQTVTRVAFVQGGPTWGCSPDGLVYDDGGIETKVYTDSAKHMDALDGINGHIDQIQFNLFCTGRKWWDFVSYYPEQVEELRLSIKRYYPNKLLHAIYADKLELFEKYVGEIIESKRPIYLATH